MKDTAINSVFAIAIIALIFIPAFGITYLAIFDQTFSWARGFALVTVSAFGLILANGYIEMRKSQKEDQKRNRAVQ